jgi:hypothetical protein
MSYDDEIKAHYVSCWKSQPNVKRLQQGPTWELPEKFCVLEFPPTASRQIWTYATCGMAQPGDREALELFLFAPSPCELHVELLTVVAHFHRTGEQLGLGHFVNFGRPWLEGSACEYGLISLPYLDGPLLEEARFHEGTRIVRCLWLLPITKRERDYALEHGLEGLEQRFEQANVDYINPLRRSVA